MIRGYIEQEGLSVRVTRSTGNRELLDLIESEMEGPKPGDGPEDAPRGGRRAAGGNGRTRRASPPPQISLSQVLEF